MDKKTQLTKFIPDLTNQWNRYKNGLKGLKIKNWCISSDYCFDDPNKLNVATFTVFPSDYMNTIFNELKENLPRDIKNKRHFTEAELNYLKNSKYFFSMSIILYNIESSFNKNAAIEQITKLLKTQIKDLPFPIIDKDFHEAKEKLRELLNNLKKKNCPIKKLSQIYFVAQFVAQLMEFLFIKENCKIVGWCPDKGHIDSFSHGIIYNLVQTKIHELIRNRMKDFRITCPPPESLDKHLYMRDTFIRIPDIITGALSSLVVKEKGITAQQPKHYEIINRCLVNNPRMIHLIYDFGKNGQPVAVRAYFESIDKYP